MRIIEYLRLIFSLPPRVTFTKGKALLRRKIAGALAARIDRRNPSFLAIGDIPNLESGLSNLLTGLTANDLIPQSEMVHYLSAKILEHKFNLLGSGWVTVEHGMQCKGLEGYVFDMPDRHGGSDGINWIRHHINPANRAESESRYKLIRGEYSPIDWHIDFRSGYRWSATTPSHQIRYGHVLGADVKLPWELARMQHLPQLAYAYALSKAGDEALAPPDRYLQEFRNQVLDFIACNPPRFGVNWSCAMDVAIRAANWLVAYDLFRGFGASFDADFDQVLRASLYDHGYHIINNLEWFEDLRSNHYLANICGLLFIAAYLPQSTLTDQWLRLCLEELGYETNCQFQEDGSNFEASTCYHRLSAEMVVYATSIAHAVDRKRIDSLEPWSPDEIGHGGIGPLPARDLQKNYLQVFSQEHYGKLEDMAFFTWATTFPDGNDIQIGDNDSGRFLKFQSPLENAGDGEYEENSLDHSHLIAACSGLLNTSFLNKFSNPSHLDAKLLNESISRSVISIEDLNRLDAKVTRLFHPFANFGLYVHRGPRIYLTVRCGSVGQNSNGGHAHNDQLAISIAICGKCFVVDLGTGIYTPNPKTRNTQRATRSHSTVQVEDIEQFDWNNGAFGLFRLSGYFVSNFTSNSANQLSGEFRNQLYFHSRDIKLSNDRIDISDESDRSEYYIVLNLHPDVDVIENIEACALTLNNGGVSIEISLDQSEYSLKNAMYSPGYGIFLQSNSIWIKATDNREPWTLNILN